jgi:predicted RNA-binding Zn-ribbon protein involved in translation (DUF1610 family)
MSTRTNTVQGAVEKPEFGYCPKCGSGRMRRSGVTSNAKSHHQRYECKDCKRVTTRPLAEPFEPVVMRKTVPKVARYIVTSAQNATPVHRQTWESLLRCKEHYDAELIVIPGRYKNPTSQWTQNNRDHEWWASEVVPYLCDGWIKLGERLLVLGDVKVQWAARKPLIGLDALTKDKSAIVGHGSRALRSVATPQHKHPKIMYTTGACTVRNYTDTKIGKMGDFSHCLGGLIVEISEELFHVRQLNATKHGTFIDLDLEFSPDGVRPAPPALAIAMGDTHQRWVDPNVVKATFTDPLAMVKLLRPSCLIWNDVFDFHARNHHHSKDWLTNFAKWREGIESVRQEADETIRFVNKYTPAGRKSFVVSSNHDRATARWLREADFRIDPVNAEFYLELAQMVMRTARKTSGGVAYDDPFILYARQFAKSNVHYLEQGRSKVISQVEYGFHGDIGPNGSRGSTANLSRIGVKVTKGHSHVAEIIDGCYSVGKSTGPLEYEQGGPSNHSQSHVVQYANGKRAILTIVRGRYCLPRPKKPLLPARKTPTKKEV